MNRKAESYSEYAGMEMKINKPILNKNTSRGITKCKHACTKSRNQDSDKSTRNIAGSIQRAGGSHCVPKPRLFLSFNQDFTKVQKKKKRVKNHIFGG